MAQKPKQMGGAGTQSPVGMASLKQDLSSLRLKERTVWVETILEVKTEEVFT